MNKPQGESQTTGVLGYVQRWFGHLWTPWQDVGQGRLTDEGIVVGQFIAQSRRCLKCNKVKLRYAKTTV